MQGYQTDRHRGMTPLVASIGIGFLMMAAIVVLSSPPPFALPIAAIAAIGAVALAQLARPGGRSPAAAITVAWYASAAVASLLMLLDATSGLAFYAYMALLLLGWLEVTALSRRSGRSADGLPGWLRRHAMPLATLAALVLAWVPFWLSYFPGIMSPDSLSAWSQAASFHLSDYSPAIYTLLIRLTGTPLQSPAAVSLLQILLTAGSIAALYAYLDRQGAQRWLMAVGLGLYLGLPIFGTFTVTLWHDVLYSLLVLWVTHAMYAMYGSKGLWLASRGRSWALGAALLLIPLFAHNGLSVVFGVLVGSFLVLRAHRRRIVAIGAGVLAAFLGVQLLIYPMLGVQPYSKAFASEALIHQISAAIAQHGTTGLTASQKRYLQTIMPLRDWVQKYNPYTPQYLVSLRYNPAYREAPIDRHYTEFLKVWAEIGLRYPGSYLGERITENALVLRPTGSYKIALSSLNIAANRLGLKTHSAAQPLLDTLRRIAGFTTAYMLWLWRPFWVMWLLLGLTLAGTFLRGRIVLFTAIPWLFQVLGLAISIQGQSVRYYYSLFLILPYLVAIVFVAPPGLMSSAKERLARRFGRLGTDASSGLLADRSAIMDEYSQATS